jgi:hypothetical protein
VFARVSTYDFGGQPALVDLGPFERALDAIGDLQGFAGGYVLIDDESGTVRTVTVWNGHESLAASRVRATRLRTDAARELGGQVTSTVELRIAARR